MKSVVIKFIETDRTLVGVRNLYNKHPKKSLATQTYLSRITNTPDNLKLALYELCKLVGITERQLNIMLSKPIQKNKLIEKKQENNVQNFSELLFKFDNNSDYESFEKLVDYFKLTDLDVSEQLNKIALEKDKLIKSELKKLPTKAKESIKLRDQFPFLSKKDCPRVLHTLVSDLITAHDEFVTKQPLLHTQATQEQLKELVQDVKYSFVERKEIFQELEHYQETSTFLGKHPRFKEIAEEDEIKSMTSEKLHKKIHSLTTNINRNKSSLKTLKTERAMEKKRKLIKRYEFLLDLAQQTLKLKG